jgi:hypothetical protein
VEVGGLKPTLRDFPRERQDAGHGHDRGRSGTTKVFCFFSSEKTAFLQL